MTVQIIGLDGSQQQRHPQQQKQNLLEPPPPPPTKAQLNAIRDSWERVLTIRHPDDDLATSSAAVAFSQAFYDALFTLNKGMAKPFSNIRRQAICLTGIVSYIARAPAIMPARYKNLKLREMERDASAELDPDEERWMEGQLQALGARHHHNAVFTEESANNSTWFDHVGPALIIALQRRLDREFAEDVGDAWLQAHKYVAYHMKLGMKQQQQQRQQLENRHALRHGQTRGNCVIQ